MSAIKNPPINTELMMRQLPIPVYNKIAAPIKQARVDVSPTDPGIIPMKDSVISGILLA